MAIAICLRAAGPETAALEALREEAASFEETPQISVLGYPPHVTLAVYDELSAEEMEPMVSRLFAAQAPVELIIRGLRWFEAPRSPLVLYAASEPSAALEALHRSLHRSLPEARCHPHYRPGTFIAHCTLAMGIPPSRRDAMTAYARSKSLSIALRLDIAEVVAFPPVRVVEEYRLAG